MSGPFAPLWALDPEVVFLNHGSFGACPRAVLEEQTRLRGRLEAEPVRFLARELEPLVDAARAELAGFLDTRPEALAFVTNATTGVNTALRSLPLGPGDEVLTTDHAYRACRNALNAVAAAAGADVVVARVPFPLASAGQAVDAVLAGVTPRTRAALLDHVASPTGLVLPVEPLVAELEARGIRVVVDGAHAPGMVPLALDRLGASCYAGNCHKWMCAPKGAGFLWVRDDLRDRVRPLVISHGASLEVGARSRFWLELDWTGTFDPTPWLCVPTAIRTLGDLLRGGWTEVRHRNRALALEARALLAEALGVAPPCPGELVGSLAALPLPAAKAASAGPAGELDPLQEALYAEHRIEVPIILWPSPPHRLLRISAQLYNTIDDYARLAEALQRLIGRT